MLNSSVGDAVEWFIAGGKWLPARAVQIVPEAPSVGKVSTLFPPPPPPPTAESQRVEQKQCFFVID